jgi:hypothetical protein
MYPPVLQMEVHLPGMHMVPFNDTDSHEEVAALALSQRFMLTEYFKTNIDDPKARQYLYKEFPEHYIWVKSGKYWKPRKQRFQIGRLVYANPAEGCRYYLRILLNHVRGATSYESLRTVRGVLCPTFRDACEKLGLITSDGSLDEAMSKASHFQMSCTLRLMFSIIAVFCEYADIRKLWDNHFESMAEDYCHNNGDESYVVQLVLRDVVDIVRSMGKDIKDFGLPHLDESGTFFMKCVIIGYDYENKE